MKKYLNFFYYVIKLFITHGDITDILQIHLQKKIKLFS